MIIKYLDVDCAFLEKYGHKIHLNGSDYFYFPYWCKKLADGLFEEFTYEQMPPELIEALLKQRNEPTIPQNEEVRRNPD